MLSDLHGIASDCCLQSCLLITFADLASGVCSFVTCEVCCVSLLCRSGFVSTFEIFRIALYVCSTGKSCLEFKIWGKSDLKMGCSLSDEQVGTCMPEESAVCA